MPSIHEVIPELDKIQCELSECCGTEYGRRQIRQLPSFESRKGLEAEIEKVRRAALYYTRAEIDDIAGVENIDHILDKACKGVVISEEEFAIIRGTLESLIIIADKMNTQGVGRRLEIAFHAMPAVSRFADTIRLKFSQGGELRHDATPELAAISSECARCRKDAHDKLARLLSAKRKFLQEEYFSVRDGRYVIPVKAGNKKDVPGVVLDISQSGDTLFVEPYGMADLNSRLLVLHKREQREKMAILHSLSRLLAAASGDIARSMAVLGRMDALVARAKYMIRENLSFPDVADGHGFCLLDAVHPLYRHGDAVRNDFKLDHGKSALIVTGPNGGGKTVSLKTVSSIIFLTHHAVPTPVGEGSQTGFFKEYFFDMGDTQDMQKGRSSFSAKMLLWKAILDRAREGSLVVIDELGNYTNPFDGAAISCAMIRQLVDKRITLIAGTHLDQVKEFALTLSAVDTASMMWDARAMKPLYKIHYGDVTGSYALETIKAIGFDDVFVGLCDEYRKSEYIELMGIRKKYEELLDDMKLKTARMQAEERRLADAASQYERQTAELRDEGMRSLAEFRERADGLMRRFSESCAVAGVQNRKISAAVHEFSNTCTDLEREMTERISGEPITYSVGDNVIVRGIGKKGKIVDIDGDSVVVLVGRIKMAVAGRDIMPAGKTDGCDAKSAGKGHILNLAYDREMGASDEPTLDLRGCTIDEISVLIEKFIDGAIIQGVRRLKIIHGAGPGKLKEVVCEHLKSHFAVAGFKPGSALERGGSYYTIVEMR